jgi:diguanylate cyclase (GGDEF)-like protein
MLRKGINNHLVLILISLVIDTKNMMNRPGVYETKLTVILTMAILLPLLLFGVLTLQTVSKTVTESIADDLKKKSLLVSNDINQFINERVSYIGASSQAEILRSNSTSNITQQLKALVGANSWINHIDALESDGIIFASSRHQSAIGKHILNQHPNSKSIHTMLASAQQGEVFVAEASEHNRRQGLLMMTPVVDSVDGSVTRALFFEVNFDSLTDIISLFGDGLMGGNYAYIIDSTGRVLASNDPSMTLLSPIPSLSVQHGLLDTLTHHRSAGHVIYSDQAGTEMMATYADIDEFGANRALDWTVIVIAPMDVVAAMVSKIRLLLFSFATAVAALTILCVFFYVSKLQRSLKEIARVSTIISQGDYSKRLVQSGQSGALGLLTRAFNHMTKALANSVKQLEEREAVVKHQAHYDRLTGLPNRFLIIDRLSQLLKEAALDNSLVGIMFLDIDNFKKINDSLGHEHGDKVILEVSHRLSDHVHEADSVGRLGGDEFVVLLKGIKNCLEAKSIADNIRFVLGNTLIVNDRELQVTASIGISIYPDNGTQASELLKHADSAMYAAKDSGRNTVAVFDDELDQKITRRLAVEEQMQQAVDSNEFEVYYQPKIDITSGHIIGAEALLRWTNSALGSVYPDEFIPIAEQTGLINPIGQFVVKEAFEATKEWNSNFDETFVIAVNLSPKQLKDPQFVLSVKESLHRIKISPACVEMEITEGILMGDHSYINDALNDLYILGIKIALDDFGTGYSSLSYLRKYPFDILKIDRSFIHDITAISSNKELTSAAIAMAHSLNLKVVAEGIETTEQLNLLKEMKCEYGQGYLFSKPVSRDEMTQLLESSGVKNCRPTSTSRPA